MFSAYVAGISQPSSNVARGIRISQGPMLLGVVQVFLAKVARTTQGRINR